jgi:hypothetical protein
MWNIGVRSVPDVAAVGMPRLRKTRAERKEFESRHGLAAQGADFDLDSSANFRPQS